ncbi:hypothetical protein [Paraburkholderia kururiensis]|uniref:Phasin domain-containing protein n=1 Tax=Paraburkholderia kururiensis TaxID=984307 RepID=A0ABZ0WQS1_9BURK|nr:hypothetical protein [Paraburkholderia kururiensis]WQD79732.1 hypothetical protein U0042_08640 [Paraburkholderia kururiensis]
MANEYNALLETCRANATIALRMLALGQQWRQQALTWQQRRMERDRNAVQQALGALAHAQDWNEMVAGYHTVVRDYLSASTSLWQDGIQLATQAPREAGNGVQDALRQWQGACAGEWQKLTTTHGAALPMRDWMAAFERTAESVAHAVAQASNSSASYPASTAETADAASTAEPSVRQAAAARSRAAKGDRHAD